MIDATPAERAAEDAVCAAYREAAEDLKRYVDILAGRGIEWGLLGPREGERLWQRHVGNSLALVDALPQGADVADVGSGAGLPGLPLAIVRSDLRVTLIEPLLRRYNFLVEAVQELGLGERVTVVRSRAEDAPGEFDVVVCRAVAPLAKLLKWTMPLLGAGGQLVALKGDTAEDEIAEAGRQLTSGGWTAEVLELPVAAGVEGTRAIRVR